MAKNEENMQNIIQKCVFTYKNMAFQFFVPFVQAASYFNIFGQMIIVQVERLELSGR